jgi:hypothetical protein
MDMYIICVCVCVCVYIYICIYMYIHVYICVYNVHIHIYIYMHVCIYVCITHWSYRRIVKVMPCQPYIHFPVVLNSASLSRLSWSHTAWAAL